MSVQTVATRFVELCNQGKNLQVLETMYAPGVVSVERDGEETVGQTPDIEKSRAWKSNNEVHSEKVRGPYFSGPSQFAVHFTIDVTQKTTGKRVTLEEVGVFTVVDDRITREQFFNDWER
jgi:hypothetical protein